MSIAEFPLPSVSGSNPIPLYFESILPTFKVSLTEYDDGGEDVMRQAGTSGRRMWIVKYDGLTEAEAAILDAHVASAYYDDANGSAESFNLRDRNTAVLYSGVRYAPGGYAQSHTKSVIQSREILLKKAS